MEWGILFDNSVPLASPSLPTSPSLPLLASLSSLSPLLPSTSTSPLQVSSSPLSPSVPPLELQKEQQQQPSSKPSAELLTYSRRKKFNLELRQVHESKPDLGNKIPLSPTTIESDPIKPTPQDLDLPIALRKGIRNCTHHPISQLASFYRLSL